MGRFANVNMLEREPYDVGRFAWLPGTKPYLFYLKLKPEALRIPGTLERLVRSFTKLNIPILQLKISAPQDSEVLRAIVIADLANREELIDKLANGLKSIPAVISVEYEPPLLRGLAIDSRSFPLRLAGDRAVIVRKDVYEGLIRGGWEKLGSGYGQLLYLIGFEIGRRMFNAHSRIVGNRELVVEFMKRAFQLAGMGVINLAVLDDNEKRSLVRVYDSFECELFKGSKDVRGNLIRGKLAGWLAERWGGLSPNELIAREVKCIARGDPYCEYSIRTGRKRRT